MQAIGGKLHPRRAARREVLARLLDLALERADVRWLAPVRLLHRVRRLLAEAGTTRVALEVELAGCEVDLAVAVTALAPRASAAPPPT